MKYKIIRMFFNDDVPTKTIKTGLEQAKKHWNDKETSSSTCENVAGIKLTEQCGAWFDGYEKQ